MSIIITIDVSEITKKIDGVIDDGAKFFFYNEFYSKMKPYVPADTSTMYDTAVVTSEGIHFIQPYSSAPYYGKTKSGGQMHFKTAKHPLATDHWDIATWSAKKGDICDALQDHINRRNRNG